MTRYRNRVTPILVIILIVVFWIFIAVLLYKLKQHGVIGVKKLKIDDDLVQELYSYTTDDDIIIYSNNKYNIDNLPKDYIFSKATRFMTIEDVYFNNGQFKISYDSLDGAIKTCFGPDIKYNLSDIDGSINTYLEYNDHRLLLNVKYDSTNREYYGTYSEISEESPVLVDKKLLSATKTDTVNLKIGYVFYKQDTNYKVCDTYKCEKIVGEFDNIEDYDYNNNTITISLKKASDEVYYYYSNK